MSWILLGFAGLLEVVWALALKESQGFSRGMPTVIFLVANISSMVLLGLALRELPVGTGYAIWVGIGAVGTALLGMVLFGDVASVSRIAAIGLISVGVIWLAIGQTAS